MTDYLLFDEARFRLDEILDYTHGQWGDAQAVCYLDGMLARFQAIADREVPWRRIPAEFGTDGYVCRHGHHFIYWKVMDDGAVGIVTILHERMQQMDLLRDAFAG